MKNAISLVTAADYWENDLLFIQIYDQQINDQISSSSVCNAYRFA
jgi:hypothetical protein